MNRQTVPNAEMADAQFHQVNERKLSITHLRLTRMPLWLQLTVALVGSLIAVGVLSGYVIRQLEVSALERSLEVQSLHTLTLLSAVAMMAAGWDGGPQRDAPGFPDNGKWKVRYEGLKKMP